MSKLLLEYAGSLLGAFAWAGVWESLLMRRSVLVVLCLLTALTQTASAALPAVVGATLTEIQNDALALIHIALSLPGKGRS